MGLAEIKADARLSAERIAAVDFDSMDLAALRAFIKTELTDNLYPLIEGAVDATDEIAGEIEGELEELGNFVEGDADGLMPETAERLIAVYALGKLIANDAEALMKEPGNELIKKRLKKNLGTFRQSTEVAIGLVKDLTIEVDDDKPDAETAPDGDAEQDGEDGDQDDDVDDDDGDEEVG